MFCPGQLGRINYSGLFGSDCAIKIFQFLGAHFKSAELLKPLDHFHKDDLSVKLRSHNVYVSVYVLVHMRMCVHVVCLYVPLLYA